MMPQQFADEVVAKMRRVADVYVKVTLNNVFIGVVNLSFRHSLQNCWAQNPQEDLNDVMFQVESLLCFQKDAGVVSYTDKKLTIKKNTTREIFRIIDYLQHCKVQTQVPFQLLLQDINPIQQ